MVRLSAPKTAHRGAIDTAPHPRTGDSSGDPAPQTKQHGIVVPTRLGRVTDKVITHAAMTGPCEVRGPNFRATTGPGSGD